MKMLIEFDTDKPEDVEQTLSMLQRWIADLDGDDAKSDPEADKKAKAKAKRQEKAAEKAATEKAETSDDDNMTGDEEAGIDREVVRTALKEYAALEGKEAAIAILKEHGSPSIGELDEEQFAAVIKACE